MTLWERIKLPFVKSRPNDADNYPDITNLSWFWQFSRSLGFDGSKSRNALNGGLSRYQVIYKDYRELRKQARKSWIESTETRAVIGRSVELTVSTGLKLEWTPAWNICLPNSDKETQKKIKKKVEGYWKLYAESKESDITGRKTFYQTQFMARRVRKIDGEYFGIVRYLDNDTKRMSPIAIQFIRPEQVANPSKQEDLDMIQKMGRYCVDGIELDQNGCAVAYYVYDTKGSYVRIPKYDAKSKRIFMIHGANLEEIGQFRGISSIASYLHELNKLTSYKLAELQAAVVNALLAVWIKPGQENDSSKPLKGITRRDQLPTPQVLETPRQAETNESGIVVQNLKKGEEIVSFDTRRPNVNYEKFHDSILRGMTASEGYAYSVVSMTFNSNYSAHRGELLLTWNKIEIEREEENADLNNVIFRQWLTEMVKSGKLPELTNFLTNEYITSAWCKADWIGFPKLDIDPNKTVQAAAARVKEGFSTRARETAGINGSEFEDNVEALIDENAKLYEANKYMIETSVRGSAKPPMETPESDDDETDMEDEDIEENDAEESDD